MDYNITIQDKWYRFNTFTSMGQAIALILSYAVNDSILWGILHCFCGWWYVIYWLFSHTAIKEWILQWVVK